MKTKKTAPRARAAGTKKARRRSTSFPMTLFKNLLSRYCQDNFTKTNVKENAMFGTPYIGVCIGDQAGSLNQAIIDGIMAAAILGNCGTKKGGKHA
jgi:hypothetical protein